MTLSGMLDERMLHMHHETKQTTACTLGIDSTLQRHRAVFAATANSTAFLYNLGDWLLGWVRFCG